MELCPLGPSAIDTIVAPAPTNAVAVPVRKSAAEMQSAYADQLAAVADFAEYGPVLGSSKQPAPLTESETEYVVSCVKHVFKQHIVFQVRLIFTSSRVCRLLAYTTGCVKV